MDIQKLGKSTQNRVRRCNTFDCSLISQSNTKSDTVKREQDIGVCLLDQLITTLNIY